MSLAFLSQIGSLWLFVVLAILLIFILVLVFMSGMVRGAAGNGNGAPAPAPDAPLDPKSPPPQSKELVATRGPGWTSSSASFARTMAFLKNTVTGRDYRYQIPWFLVIGEPGSGKSTMLSQTGVNLAPEEGSGQASAKSPLEWRFLDKGILLGVAGNYVAAGDGQARDEHGWTRLLKLLQNNRPRRPLDGVVLTIPASDLIGPSAMEEAQLGNRAARMADLLAQAQRTLGFSFPVYVVVTKCDEVTGFASFCRELPPRAEHEIFGWSSPYNVEATFTSDWVTEAFDYLSNQMRMLQSEIFVDKNDLAQPEDVFLFPEELTRMRTPARIYLDRLLRETAYRESFRFRGIYFTGDISEKPVTDVPLAPAAMSHSRALVPVGASAIAGVADLPSSLPPSMEEDAAIPGSWMSEIAPARARAANRFSVKSPVFLKDLFERKIFPEAGLAQPLSRLFLARTRSVLIVQLTAAVVTIVLTTGTILGYRHLAQDRGVVLEMLGHMVKISEKTSEQYSLLPQMTPAGNVKFKSVFLPSSYFDSVDNEITDVMVYACKTWVLANMRSELGKKAQGILKSGEAPPKTGDPEASNPASVDALPEFQQLDAFVSALVQFEEHRQIYNELRLPGNISEFVKVRELIDYLYPGTPFQDFTKDGHLDTALRRAYGDEFAILPKDRDRASKLMKDMIGRTFDKWFDSSLLLDDVYTLREKIGALEQGRTATYASLKELLDIIKLNENDLRSPGFQWAGHSSLDLQNGPLRRVIYDPVISLQNPYLNRDVFDYAVTYGNERLSLLRIRLGEENTPMTGPLLDVQNPIVLSRGARKLQLALENALNLKFMSQLGSRTINTQFDRSQRLIWHVEPLQDAVQLFEIYRRFTEEALLDSPSRLRDSLARVALTQLKRGVEDDIAQAQEVLPRNAVNTQLVAEDPTFAEVTAFQQAYPLLLDLANRSQHLGFVNIRNATMYAASLQSFNLLSILDSRLCEEHPYAAKGVRQADCQATDRKVDRMDHNSFSWWSGTGAGKPPLSLQAYGARDSSELQDELTGKRDHIKAFVQQAEPIILFLNTAVPNRQEAQSKLISKWEKLVIDFKQYDGKKPGATIGSLESFVLADIDKISQDTACADPSSTGEMNEQNLDYFLQIRADIRNSVIDRCKNLSSDEVIKTYSDISDYFNAHLKGRFPFGPNPRDKNGPEVSTQELRDFYALFDRNAGQARLTLSENGTRFGESAQRAIQFLDQMNAIRPFVAQKEAPFSFDVTPRFRVNQASESGANEIIEWTMQIGGQIFHQGEPDHAAHWQAGYPIRLALRWATDSIYQPHKPANDGSQPNLRVRDRSAFYEFLDSWSLLSFVMRQQAVPSELGPMTDASNYNLKFRVRTVRDPKWAKGDMQEGNPAVAFMHLSIAMPGSKAPVTLPYFPPDAPILTGAGRK
jgi:type VI secretion system protein ImpL